MAVVDAFWRAQANIGWKPESIVIDNYHDDPGYIAALANSIRSVGFDCAAGDKLLLSLHAIPLKDEKAGKISKVTIEERLHNAFGSRIGDKEKKKVYLPTSIKKVEKDKKGNVDIHFANGEVWRNPPKKKKEDNTNLESSGGTGGGRRGYGRRGYGRRGYGGRGGGGGGSSASVKQPTSSRHLNLIKPKGTPEITVRPKQLTKHGGLTKAELKALIKASKQGTNAKTTELKTSNKDIYKIKGSQRK
jgi:hypothetical protein